MGVIVSICSLSQRKSMPQSETYFSIIRFQFSSRRTDEKQGSRISRFKIVQIVLVDHLQLLEV